MARTHSPGKREAERRFLHRVDIRVPPTGLGGRLSAMLTWCRENVPAGAWDMHWHSEKKAGGDTARLRAVLLRERSGR